MPCGLVRIPRSELEDRAAAVENNNDATRVIAATVFDGSDGVRVRGDATADSPQVAKSMDGKLWFAGFDGVRVVMDKSGEFGMVANDSHKAPPAPLSGKIATTGSITVKNSSITGPRANSGNLFSKDEVSTGTFSFKDSGGNSWTGDR